MVATYGADSSRESLRWSSEIYQALREDLAEFVDASGGSRAKRGAMSVARFKILGRLAWTRENGLEPEVWDNQA